MTNIIKDDEIDSLTQWALARLRTEMFFGSKHLHTQEIIDYDSDGKPYPKEYTFIPAIVTAIREIIDNSADEVVTKGFGDKIDITYDPDTFTFTVQDNGRGIPLDVHPIEKIRKVTLALTKTGAGRNFRERTNQRGMNGVGASIVNYCSEWFQVDVIRDNQHFSQRFNEGNGKNTDLVIEQPVILPINSKGKTGTKISFKLSPKVFTHGMILPLEFLKARIYELALCFPKLKLSFNGEIIKFKGTEKNLLCLDDLITINVVDGTFNSKFFIAPNFSEKTDYNHSLVNCIPAFDGGIHIDSFKKFFLGGLIDALERESKKRKLNLNKSDIEKGSLIFNITELDAPFFSSQAKTKLLNKEVEGYIKKYFDDSNIFKSIIKNNSEWIESIYERCSERTNKKDKSEADKLAKKNSKLKVASLLDATGIDRSKCIFLAAEGLCLHENTEIKILNNGELTDKKIKDVKINDIVLTHTNSYKPVKAIWSKTSKSIHIDTSLGRITASPEHKLLVLDIDNNKFCFIEMQNLDKNKHKLVKNRLIDLSHLEEIVKIESSDVYDLKITYGNSPKIYSIVDTTNEHIFCVFDFMDMSYKRIPAKNIDVNRHCFVMIKNE